MDNFDKKQKREFTTKVIAYYESKLNDIRKNEEVEESVKVVQRKNIMEEAIDNFIVNPYLGLKTFLLNIVILYLLHPKVLMSVKDTIRSVRKGLIKNSFRIKIPYESALFQMLKRGIGIYLESMPDEYNWQLQKTSFKERNWYCYFR